MKLVLLGAPGSGKGTQAKLIAKDFSIPQISTGDLLRAAIKKGTNLGLKAKKFMNTGKLVPDDLVLQLLKERIDQKDCKGGFILDGYPRNLTQAQDLKKITEIDLVINIEVNYNLLIERITGRRTCKQCGAIYHVKYSPSKEKGVCDRCFGLLFQRDDDTEETVKKRITTYENETKPLIEFYQHKGILKTLTSDGTIEEMYEKVSSLLTMKFHL
ncbi:MAG: adenylate kinase [Candidatus Hodarchaeota archaeon]